MHWYAGRSSIACLLEGVTSAACGRAPPRLALVLSATMKKTRKVYMQTPTLPKIFEFKTEEPLLVQTWINAGCYERSQKRKNPLDTSYIPKDYTIVMPPPNVTGILHMGHALGDTIQDTLIRYHRMKGDSTRWIFGTDHAGISTQTKVDKKLKSEGVSRLEIGREKFIDACWDWTREYGGTITKQIKRMGGSCDFGDEKFTMSPEYAYAVRKVFCDWYAAGLIYRGKRIVNWCPSCKTAISDDECEYKDEPGHLWYLTYPLVEPVGDVHSITVATTRPETMLGDTGIAVSPEDSEKSALVGAKVKLPIVGREIPIFADWHVDAGYGTGFVKVTPAHDPNDFAMGQAHDLPVVNIFDETAHVVEGFGSYSGMSRDEARAAVLAAFEKEGLLERVSDIEHAVMHCYRCDTALEPWLSEQWFVDVSQLTPPALEAANSGEVKFNSKRWLDSYTTWMEGLRDWCISRQLWWGHRIPVFYCDACGWQDASMTDVETCPACGSAHVRQDEDVLDTWFSSQLWPFATQGWPEHPEELEGHFPTAALVTARDIIALWVARMVMASYYFEKKPPFHDVIIYPTILAKDGSRMSKSRGNGVDPLDLINRYGADAMRHNLLGLVTQNQDVRFDADFAKDGSFKGSPRTEQSRAFVSKVWNATRFCLLNLSEFEPGAAVAKTPEDSWILSRLAKTTEAATQALDCHDFNEYVHVVTSFFWQEVCDWYIELTKARVASEDSEVRKTAQRNLVFVLDASLRLLHPVVPFVTEALFAVLPQSELPRAEDSPLLIMAPWPEPAYFSRFTDDASEKTFELARALISSVRAVRARFRISPHEPLAVSVRASEADWDALASQLDFVKSVGRVSRLEQLSKDAPQPTGSVGEVFGALSLFVHVGDIVDLEAEAARLQKQIDKAQKECAGVERTLANEGFLAKADPAVIAEKRTKVEELKATEARLREQLEGLSRD